MANYDATDEVTTIPSQEVAFGFDDNDTWVLTIELIRLDMTFSTGNMYHTDTSETIQTSINQAAKAANIPGWTDDDISVAETGDAGISNGDVTLTFDGDSVKEQPVLVTAEPTGFTWFGEIERTTPGQTDRPAMQELFATSVVSGTLHNSGEAPTDWVKPRTSGQTRPRARRVLQLGIAACQEDGTDYVMQEILRLYPNLKTV